MTSTFRSLLTALVLPVFLSQCTGVFPGLLPPSRVTRMECLRTAESYRTHRWTPRHENVRHGADSKGIRIDTPDISYHPAKAIPGWWVPGTETVGVPYQWGGYSTLPEFDRGIREGKAAGDVYTDAKRAALDDAVSADAVGIDCSGFISRCWKLPRSYSTRELPLLCRSIGWDELEPGDILNVHNAHCLLIADWDGPNRERVLAYETGSPPTWKVVSHTIEVSWLKSLGYQPYRYRGMQDSDSQPAR